MADFAKRFGEIIGRIAVVFDDQEAHGDPAVATIGQVPGGALILRTILS